MRTSCEPEQTVHIVGLTKTGAGPWRVSPKLLTGIMARETKAMAQAALKLVGKEDGEKQRALEAAIAQIDRAFGKGSVMKLGKAGVVAEIESVSTGSLGLDMALGIGGLPVGRVIECSARNPPARPPWPCTRWPRCRRRAGSPPSSTPNTPGSSLRSEAGREPGRSLGVPARRRGTGAGDRGHPGALGRCGHRGGRLGRGPDAARRNRGRDGRQLPGFRLV